MGLHRLHNRPAHEFAGFEEQVDLAMTEGDLIAPSRSSKREALAPFRTLGCANAGPVRSVRSAASADIPDVYRKRYPDVYRERSGDIARAARRLRTILPASSLRTCASRLNVPQLGTHEGCFDARGARQAVSKAREELDKDCTLCHFLPNRRTR